MNDEFRQEWLSHPLTKSLIQTLNSKREELKEDLASGVFIDDVSKMQQLAVSCQILEVVRSFIIDNEE